MRIDRTTTVGRHLTPRVSFGHCPATAPRNLPPFPPYNASARHKGLVLFHPPLLQFQLRNRVSRPLLRWVGVAHAVFQPDVIPVLLSSHLVDRVELRHAKRGLRPSSALWPGPDGYWRLMWRRVWRAVAEGSHAEYLLDEGVETGDTGTNDDAGALDAYGVRALEGFRQVKGIGAGAGAGAGETACTTHAVQSTMLTRSYVKSTG